MSEFKIEKNVPIPTSGGGLYPWHEMTDGDSFFVACPDEDAARKASVRVSNSGRVWYKTNNPKLRVVVRTVDGGVRVWVAKR